MAIPRNLANLANQLNTDGEVPKIEVGDSKVEVTDTGSDGTITFDTDGSERMRINNAGNVGIGVTPSAWNSAQRALQVGATGVIYGTSGDVYFGNNIFVNSSDSNTYITTDEATVYRQVNNSHIWYGAASGTAGASITLTERMRINAGSNILCLAGGNTSATGTGIAFPATQSASTDANTLDDYEEGTFTPGIHNGLDFPSPGGSASYTGKYTKIGNVVYVTILLNFNASGTNMAVGDAVEMNGLPFSSSVTPLGAGMGNSIPSLGTADRAFHWVGFRSGTNFGVVITDLQGTVNFGTSLTLSFAYFV